MRLGAFVQQPMAWPSPDVNGASLYDVALTWLREDMRLRRELESSGGRKLRGPRRGASSVPTDSETFYKKSVSHFCLTDNRSIITRYDYSH